MEIEVSKEVARICGARSSDLAECEVSAAWPLYTSFLDEPADA